MVGLLDIAPVGKPVEVDGAIVDVPGISALGIATLLQQFPEAIVTFQKLMGRSKKGDSQDIAQMLFSTGPKILHAILAAGCGYPGDERAVERVAAMGVSDQADLLDAILKKTLSKGLDHFLERLRSIQATLTPPATLADKIQEAVQKKRHLSSPSNSSSVEQITTPATSGA